MAEAWRLFVAIPLSDAVRQLAADTRKRLRHAHLFKGRYGRPEAMHLTLAFLGDLEIAQVDEAARRLAEFSFEPFSIRVDRLGTFGQRRPRVVWLGLVGDALFQLQAQVAACLREFIPNEDRPYHPHLTLARVKKAPPLEQWQEQLAALTPEPSTMPVQQVQLIRSLLAPDSARHSTVAEIRANE